MKKADVVVGRTYRAKISGHLTDVRLTAESRFGGWDAVNVRTKRSIRIRSAAKLRFEVSNEAPKNRVACVHQFEEQPGEPPVDVCTRCGAVRY